MYIKLFIPMKKLTYSQIFILCLLGYIIFNIAYIGINHTMQPPVKITATSICILVCLISSIKQYKWHAFLVFPFSVFLWALIIDGFTGLWFHSDFFYMSENTWPDKQLLRVVQNGEMYFVFKSIGLLVTGGLIKIAERFKQSK